MELLEGPFNSVESHCRLDLHSSRATTNHKIMRRGNMCIKVSIAIISRLKVSIAIENHEETREEEVVASRSQDRPLFHQG